MFSHQQPSEVQLGLVSIVRPASELQIVGGRRAANGVRDDMVELEKAPFGAPAVRALERTLAVVPSPDLASDCPSPDLASDCGGCVA